MPKEYQECGYVRAANEYIAAVLAGTISACEFIRQACERQAADLANPDFAYRFDVKKAENVCYLIEMLKHVEGPKAGRLIKLEPWQCFILTTVFGWVSKDTGARRFRRVYIEVPKGNGKSILSSAVLIYLLIADNEGGAQCYSAATTRDQAKIVFGIAQKMLRKCPKICEKFGVTVGAHDITVERTASFARSVSSDADSIEGINPHLCVVDELHAHQNRSLWDNLETAHGKRDQDLLWAITTAGGNVSGICYEVRSYVLDILAGKKHDESVFGVVYTIDSHDDWATEASLRKANPNWGVSFSAADRMQKLTKAMQLASAQSSFKTKHLNVWVSSAHGWMNMRDWGRCADPTLDIEQFALRDCIVGMDLASRKDLASIIKVFWKEIEGQRHYYCFGRHFLPEEAAEASENSQYLGWVEEGRITTTPGPVNNYRLFTEELKDSCTRFNVLEIAHDPYLADLVIGDMVESGVPTLMVKVAQNVANFSPALKELEALVMSGRLHHDGDPVLAWAVSNIEVKPDFHDNIYPRKARNQDKNKIDPVVALLMAINRALSQVTESGFEVLGVI
jgi:phage terminase large subunit-like protein